LRRWEFSGDRLGLQRFYNELMNFIVSTKSLDLSEHIHLGPYSYLKIVKWDSAFISSDGFYGTNQDFKKLADIFLVKLKSVKANCSFTIDEEFSKSNKAYLLVNIKEDGFDPSSLD
jgi:hypothetical protein